VTRRAGSDTIRFVRSFVFFVVLATLGACDKDKGTAERAKDGLAILPPTYGPNSNVPGEAREKCGFDDDLGDELVQAIPGSGIDTSAGADKQLLVEITRINGAEANWEGKITVILEGKLERSGETFSFRLKRSSLGGVTGGMPQVCRGLDKLAKEMALDLADFVERPSKGADLGE
jgi:hypothetical protein